MDIITKQTIVSDFRKLGIILGDVVFITADLSKVGYVNKSQSQTINDWKEILKEVVGENGSVIVAAYTEATLFFKKSSSIFQRFSRSYAGSLANGLIKDSTFTRSTHPTNSCIGFGVEAYEILKKHTPQSLSYEFLEEIIKRGGKFLMIGTIDSNNAPPGIHYAQEKLGFTKFSLYKNLFYIKYYNEFDEIKKFIRKDFGGCSRGGLNLYGHLISNDIVKIHKIGNAISCVMPAKESSFLIRDLLNKNRKIIQCGNKDCIDCYGNFVYNNFGIVPFYFSNIIKIGQRLILKILG